MMSKILLVLLVAIVAMSAEAFAPAFLPKTAITTTTPLFACRANAKKEKRKRNRENMRKFATPSGGSRGRRTLTRRKQMKKLQSNKARQLEAEFIAKCFTTGPPPNVEEEES
mmetsp:Transcript_1177/g.2773  ORF Transcript_1177/g.2773 Transcript_1177/m.2773 type:complete len:112 (+) Transcript_1177:141-476(+)